MENKKTTAERVAEALAEIDQQTVYESPEEILQSICKGDEELLAMGRRFNQAVIDYPAEHQFSTGARLLHDGHLSSLGMNMLGNAAHFLTPDDKFMLVQIDRLGWNADERGEFYDLYYRDCTQRYPVRL